MSNTAFFVGGILPYLAIVGSLRWAAYTICCLVWFWSMESSQSQEL